MRKAVLATVMGLLAAALSLRAGMGASLDGAQREQAVAQLSAALKERYVYPDVGAKAADAITAKLKGGAYDKLDDPIQFTARLTTDLYASTHDLHLRVVAPGSPPPVRVVAPGSPPSVRLPPQPPRNEAGVVRADRLAGGVGYIEVVGFPRVDQFKPAIDRAMSALAGSKALIIDDRRNTGGDPAAVAYLVSFLVPQGAHINDVVFRTPNTTDFRRQEFRALATPVNFAGLPMIVLTSAITVSGGEEFAYDVQNLKAATVIGEITAGGANPTGGVPLNANMVALIPNGRAENPVTKTNWEGKGVQPDVTVAAPEALRAALTRLGRPAVADIGAASMGQVYAPRTTQLAGSEAALRRLIAGLASNTPDYATMSPPLAEITRQQLPQLHAGVSQLGALQGMTFVEVDPRGGDVYNVAFAGGVRRFEVVLDADGKVVGAQALGPPVNPGS